MRSYQEGRLEAVDLDHLGSLGYGAVPYLEELANDADPETVQAAKDILTRQRCRTEDFRDWNYSRAAAEKILEPYQEQAEVLPG